MADETLFTASRRMVRFLRIDDERHGGLISRDTIRANETLAREVQKEEKRQAAAGAVEKEPDAS